MRRQGDKAATLEAPRCGGYDPRGCLTRRHRGSGGPLAGLSLHVEWSDLVSSVLWGVTHEYQGNWTWTFGRRRGSLLVISKLENTYAPISEPKMVKALHTCQGRISILRHIRPW